MNFRVHFGLLAGLLAACTSEIGDGCTTSSDCAVTEADRLCLTEALEGFPGGYCTEFNCEPGSCPGEAVCVGYRTTLANSEACAEGSARLQRSYCMRSCSRDGDCRDGYACVDMGDENVWGAEIIEKGKRASKTKVCTLAYTGAEEGDRSSDVCRWRTADLDGGSWAGAAEEPSTNEAGPASMSQAEAGLTETDAGSSPEPTDAAVPDPGMPDADLADADVAMIPGDSGAIPQSEAGVATAADAAGSRPNSPLIDAAVEPSAPDAATPPPDASSPRRVDASGGGGQIPDASPDAGDSSTP
jgi:hypothetical protein